MQVHCSELACADAPSATVAGVFVHADYAAVTFLFQGISWASYDARRVFTFSAGDCKVYKRADAYGAYS
jgi:hypothetical protein